MTWPETRALIGIDVAVDLGVVGGFITGEIAIGEESRDQKNNDGDDDADAETGTLRAGRPRVKILLGRRQRLGAVRRLLAQVSRQLSRQWWEDSVSFVHTVIDCLSNIV